MPYLRGLLSETERKNGWTLAETVGDGGPQGMQRVLNHYVWDTEALRDDVRDAKGVYMLRGCVLRRIDAECTYERTIDSADDWYDVLADVFHLNLTDVAAPARAATWHRVHTAHQEWEAAGQRATTL